MKYYFTFKIANVDSKCIFFQKEIYKLPKNLSKVLNIISHLGTQDHNDTTTHIHQKRKKGEKKCWRECGEMLTSIHCWRSVRSQFSHAGLSAALWAEVRKTPLSMRFPRQEYWSGFPFPPPGDFLYPGIEPVFLNSLAVAGGFFTTKRHLGSRYTAGGNVKQCSCSDSSLSVSQ